MEFDSSDEEEPSPKRHCSTPIRANAVSRRALLEQRVNGETEKEAITPAVAEEVQELEQREAPQNQDQDGDDQPGPDYFGLSTEDMGKTHPFSVKMVAKLLGRYTCSDLHSSIQIRERSTVPLSYLLLITITHSIKCRAEELLSHRDV